MLKQLLTIISEPIFSRIWGRITRWQKPRFVIRHLIRTFQRHYQISMDEFHGQVNDFPSLNQFFIRTLHPQNRPLVQVDGHFLAPCDGRLSSVEKIAHDNVMQVKGKTYKVSELLQEAIDFSQEWLVAVIYLAPHNYHRFHYPVSGRITGFNHCRGRLFSVNNTAVNLIERLYVRNERMIARIVYGPSPIYIAAVGACLVGHMVLNQAPANIYGQGWQPCAIEIAQMAEMGRFEMGSTIIMVVPANSIKDTLINPGELVHVGDRLFKMHRPALH